MRLDFDLLKLCLSRAEEKETVPTDEVNPYLLEHIIRPILRGEKVTYGDVDYDAFEDVDLRTACGYCEELDRIARRLEQLQNDVNGLQPCAEKKRAFC